LRDARKFTSLQRAEHGVIRDLEIGQVQNHASLCRVPAQ
jgi:hypothetical protein